MDNRKGFKAFHKGFWCGNVNGSVKKQYAENTVFEEDNAVPCKHGIHYCTNPFDVLNQYPLVDNDGNISEFAEVESLEKPVTDDNKRLCTKKIKIGAKLSLGAFINHCMDFISKSNNSDSVIANAEVPTRLVNIKYSAQIANNESCAMLMNNGSSSQIAIVGIV